MWIRVCPLCKAYCRSTTCARQSGVAADGFGNNSVLWIKHQRVTEHCLSFVLPDLSVTRQAAMIQS
jgi:hypothetical protein